MSLASYSTPDNLDDLDSFTKLLRSAGIMNDSEELNSFLARPYTEIQPLFNNYFLATRDFLKPIPDIQSNRLLFFPFILMSFSTALYTIQEVSPSGKVNTNAEALRKEIDQLLIGELSPYILQFFQWDFVRRTWKYHNDEYKISYLKKVMDELNDELSGNKEDIVKKYISLLLDFIVEKFQRALSHIDSMPFDDEQKSKAYSFLTQIKKKSNKEKISELIDEDVEESFLEIYKPIARNYLEGLILPTNQFDYLIYSFADAQNDYRKFIEAVIRSVQSSDLNYLSGLRTALETEDITKFIRILGSLFASVPVSLIKNTTEAYYHIFIHLVLKLAGCTIVSEAETSQGRIDMVIEFGKLIYIVEFKLSDSDIALDQIIQREYFRPYLALNK